MLYRDDLRNCYKPVTDKMIQMIEVQCHTVEKEGNHPIEVSCNAHRLFAINFGRVSSSSEALVARHLFGTLSKIGV